MMRLKGQVAAGLYKAGPEDLNRTPPCWSIYFSVFSADETANKVRSAGGKVVVEPMDVMDVGRMLVAQDPSAAYVSFWQARKHTGYTIVEEPGAVTWNELLTRDINKAVPFYEAVLGVKATVVPMPEADYTLLKVADKAVAGVMTMPKKVPAQVPSYWDPYFAVDHADAAVTKAKSLGGTPLVPTMEIRGFGRFCPLADPQGGVFSIFQPVKN